MISTRLGDRWQTLRVAPMLDKSNRFAAFMRHSAAMTRSAVHYLDCVTTNTMDKMAREVRWIW